MIVLSSSLQPPQQAGAKQTKEAEADKNVSVTNDQPLFSLEDCDALISNYHAHILSLIIQSGNAGTKIYHRKEAQSQVNLMHTFYCFIHHSYLI